MAINPRAILSIFTPGGLSLRSVNQEANGLQQRAEHIRRLQEQAFERARPNPTGADVSRTITLEQYLTAAKTTLAEANQQLPSGERPYELHQFFDFSGMKLTGIIVREQDIQAIHQALRSPASAANPERPDDNVREFNTTERGLKFNNTRFYDVTFIPSTAFGALEIGPNDTISVEGGKFIGMGDGDVLRLNGGQYSNIHFADIRGGTMELGAGARVDGVNAQGAQMHIVMGERSQLRGLHTDDATRILTMTAAPGAVIEDARLNGTTISPDSSLAETVWRNVTLDNVNLAGVDFSGATFRGVTFNGQPATFQSLRDRGVGEDQLPASIDGTRRAAVEPPSIPQQIAMAAARQLVASGASVDGEKGIERPYVPQTAEARAAIAGRNEAFAESMIALASRDTGNA
jgi:uncharacterized protein YjbI with pentapeptide repeats